MRSHQKETEKFKITPQGVIYLRFLGFTLCSFKLFLEGALDVGTMPVSVFSHYGSFLNFHYFNILFISLKVVKHVIHI